MRPTSAMRSRANRRFAARPTSRPPHTPSPMSPLKTLSFRKRSLCDCQGTRQAGQRNSPPAPRRSRRRQRQSVHLQAIRIRPLTPSLHSAECSRFVLRGTSCSAQSGARWCRTSNRRSNPRSSSWPKVDSRIVLTRIVSRRRSEPYSRISEGLNCTHAAGFRTCVQLAGRPFVLRLRATQPTSSAMPTLHHEPPSYLEQ